MGLGSSSNPKIGGPISGILAKNTEPQIQSRQCFYRKSEWVNV